MREMKNRVNFGSANNRGSTQLHCLQGKAGFPDLEVVLAIGCTIRLFESYRTILLTHKITKRILSNRRRNMQARHVRGADVQSDCDRMLNLDDVQSEQVTKSGRLSDS